MKISLGSVSIKYLWSNNSVTLWTWSDREEAEEIKQKNKEDEEKRTKEDESSGCGGRV